MLLKRKLQPRTTYNKPVTFNGPRRRCLPHAPHPPRPQHMCANPATFNSTATATIGGSSLTCDLVNTFLQPVNTHDACPRGKARATRNASRLRPPAGVPRRPCTTTPHLCTLEFTSRPHSSRGSVSRWPPSMGKALSTLPPSPRSRSKSKLGEEAGLS